VHKRILFGLAAWLLGAATATAGSLLAVSLLGQGIGGGSAQQLTEQAVTRALASEAAESSPPAWPAPSRTVHPAARPGTPSPAATLDPQASPSATMSPSAAGSPSATDGTGSPGGTVFTSKGGEVVADCQAAGAYLLFWSPLQGYEVDYVVRGPAAAARVRFESNNYQVTMVVTCSAGVPSATTSTGFDE
jgi:hypothetical protein